MDFSVSDKKFMHRAVELSLRGLGTTYPNPVVGCVIVQGNRIIGEGWHQKAGEPHAEVLALQSVDQQHRHLIKGATVYVTLEPCSHYGRTPPCAKLLSDRQVGRVVVACTDPFEKVNGKGIAMMQQAGIQVQTGCLAAEAQYANRRFLHFAKTGRPYVVLKWAQTADGFMAPEHNKPYWISGADARLIAHQWRTQEQAIMVGAGTAVADNPQLNARLWLGNNPIKVIAYANDRLPPTLKLFNTPEPTYLLTTQSHSSPLPAKWLLASQNQPVWDQWLSQLAGEGITSVQVEGGATLLKHLIETGHWNEARVFTSKAKKFEKGLKAPQIKGANANFFNLSADYLEIFIKNT